MKKTSLLILHLIFGSLLLFAQDNVADSFTELLNKHPQEDTVRVKLLNQLMYQQLALGSDKAPATGNEALQLSGKLKYTPGEILALERLGGYYQAQGEYAKALQFFDLEVKAASGIDDSISVAWAKLFIGSVHQNQSDYPLALQYYLESLKIFEETKSEKDAASLMGNIGVLYQDMGEPATAQKYYEQGLKIQEKNNDKQEITRFLNNLGGVYKDQYLFSEAKTAFNKGLALAEQLDHKHYIALISRNLMDVNLAMKNYSEAFKYGFRSLALYKSINEVDGVSDVCYLIGACYAETNKPDSAIFYADESLKFAKQIGFNRNIFNTYEVLAKAYAMKKDFAKAYQYQQQFIASKDSLNGLDRKNKMAAMKFQYDLDKKQSQIVILTKDKQLKEQEVKRQRIIAYASLICLLLVALLTVILIRNNRRTQTYNALLKERKTALQSALTELKSTQSQLIQSEKMASLGELTAGIAHEIQNPLNFVNNFSDINKELLEELKDEAGNENMAAVKAIANDLIENEKKINHHGKRADGIVKSMLQHSRKDTGVKEPTDINALCDEYLRLSYHGMRAKNKSFNAVPINIGIKTYFDESIGKINIVPQDMGRVLLNLFNNAFYAVNEKSKLSDVSYQPSVFVQTKKLNNKVEIIISDNGNGIPDSIKEKIFQPFFTTKPTGEGTGLGLSLSYDIIKAHGGEIKVESPPAGQAGKKGEGLPAEVVAKAGSAFIIKLPVV